MRVDGVDVEALSPDRFEDFVAVLGRGGISGCWAESTIYTGVASTFERLGFEVVQRRAPHKPMMRLPLT